MGVVEQVYRPSIGAPAFNDDSMIRANSNDQIPNMTHEVYWVIMKHLEGVPRLIAILIAIQIFTLLLKTQKFVPSPSNIISLSCCRTLSTMLGY